MVVYAVIGILALLAIRVVGLVSQRFFSQFDVKLVQEAVAIVLYFIFLVLFRRQMERKLRQSADWERSILEFFPIMLAVHKQGTFLYINRKGVELLGENCAEDVIGTSVMNYTHPDYRDQIAERIVSVEKNGETVSNLVHKLVRRDGQILEVLSKAQPCQINGEIATLVVAEDITEQVRKDAELQTTKGLLESFVENSIDSILVVDENLTVLRTNRAFEQMFGWKRHEVLGQTPNFIRNGIAGVADSFQQALDGQGASAQEVQCVDRQGKFIYVDFTFSPIHAENGQVIAVAVVGRDVTARKLAAEELLRSENRYRLITENMSDLITVLDANGTIQYASPSHEKIFGFAAESYIGQSAERYIHPNDQARITGGIKELGLKQEALTSEFRCKDHDDWITLEARAVPVVNADGRLESIVVASRDITERKKIEQALLEAEARYRSLVEQASLGVFIYQRGQLLYVNPRFLDIFGLQEDDMENLRVDPLQLLREEDRQLILEQMRDESRIGSRFSYQVKGVIRNGEDIYLQVYGSTLLDHGVPAILGMVEDITEQVMTQEILAKSERLGAIGQLAAGVAHEIRNPLTAIKGFLQLLQPNLSEHDESHIRIVLDELERINHIISELLYVSKPMAGKYDVKNLHQVLEDVKVLLSTQAILNNINLVSHYEDEVPFVYCDEQQLKQVFLNVIKNAIEAMPNGGQIVVTTTKKAPDKVVVSVADEGCGIPLENLPKLGVPFYTTKDKGTGLGLMVSYRIVETHQGVFAVQSQVDKGTTVTVELPTVSYGSVATGSR